METRNIDEETPQERAERLKEPIWETPAQKAAILAKRNNRRVRVHPRTRKRVPVVVDTEKDHDEETY